MDICDDTEEVIRIIPDGVVITFRHNGELVIVGPGLPITHDELKEATWIVDLEAKSYTIPQGKCYIAFEDEFRKAIVLPAGSVVPWYDYIRGFEVAYQDIPELCDRLGLER